MVLAAGNVTRTMPCASPAALMIVRSVFEAIWPSRTQLGPQVSPLVLSPGTAVCPPGRAAVIPPGRMRQRPGMATAGYGRCSQAITSLKVRSEPAACRAMTAFGPPGQRHHIGRAECDGIGEAEVEVVEELSCSGKPRLGYSGGAHRRASGPPPLTQYRMAKARIVYSQTPNPTLRRSLALLVSGPPLHEIDDEPGGNPGRVPAADSAEATRRSPARPAAPARSRARRRRATRCPTWGRCQSCPSRPPSGRPVCLTSLRREIPRQNRQRNAEGQCRALVASASPVRRDLRTLRSRWNPDAGFCAVGDAARR